MKTAFDWATLSEKAISILSSAAYAVTGFIPKRAVRVRKRHPMSFPTLFGAARRHQMPPRELPPLLGGREQMLRTAGFVQLAVARAEAGAETHRRAEAKLDAAEYALHRLLDELAGVMDHTLRRPEPARSLPSLPAVPRSVPALAA